MGIIRQLNFRKLSEPKILQLDKAGNLGVENIKSIITVVVTFFVDLILSIQDKQYSRIIATLFGMLQYGNIIALAKMAWEEVKDTTLEESNDIVAHFAGVFDIPDDRTEALIEYAISLIPRIYEIVLDGTDLFNRIISLYEEATIEFSGSIDDSAQEVKDARELDLEPVLRKVA